MINAKRETGTGSAIYRSGWTQVTGRTCAVPVKSQPRRFTAGKGFLLRNAGQPQADLLGGGLAGKQPPQVDGQPPGGRRRKLSSLPARQGRPVHQLSDRRIVRLPSHQAPDQFHQGAPDRPVAAPVDRAFMALAVGQMHSRTQPGVAGHLPPVLEPVPIKDFPGEDDPGQRSDSPRQILRRLRLQFRP